LNRESSAISNTLPQCGHFGRLKSSVASIGIAELWHADWTIIVDPSSTLLHRNQPYPEPPLWRRRDAFVKLSWLWKP
jgi:hypothetical protein